jgi:hypothetical protein
MKLQITKGELQNPHLQLKHFITIWKKLCKYNNLEWIMLIQEFEMNCANVLNWNHVTSSTPKLPCVDHNSSTFGLRLSKEQPSTMVSWHHLRKNMCWIWKRKTKASSNSCNKCWKFVSKNLTSSHLQIGLFLLIVR